MQRVVRVLCASACALSISLAAAVGARADVAFQGAQSGSALGGGSFSIAGVQVPGGSGAFLSVGVSTTEHTLVTGVSYAGQALTKRADAVSGATSGSGARAELWTLSAPPTGTGTVTVTLNDPSAPAIAGATVHTGVDVLNPLFGPASGGADTSANSANLVLDGTTATDGMVGVLALGNAANTTIPVTTGSVDTVVASRQWYGAVGGIRGAGATRTGNTGQNQALTAGVAWGWTYEDPQQRDPYAQVLVGLRKAAAAVAPTVTTADPSSVSQTGAFLGGTLVNDGNGAVTLRGVVLCPGTCSPTHDAAGSTSYGADPTSPFSTHATGLSAATKYTYRAFAVNSAGVGYGAAKTFTTPNPNRSPVAKAKPDGVLSYRITEGDGLALDASSSSDPDGDKLTFAWELDGDGDYDDATGAKPTFTPTQTDALGLGDGPASTIVSVRVSDGQANAVAYAQIDVDNAIPTGTVYGDTTVAEGSTATLGLENPTDAGPNDRSGLKFLFDTNGDGFPDGSGGDYGSALETPSVEYTPEDDGPLHLTATILDDDGGAKSYTRDVTVTNVAPTATLTADGPVAEGGEAHVTFSGASDPSRVDADSGFRYAYDLDGDGDWDIGDGTYLGGTDATTATVPATDDGTIAVRGKIIDKDDDGTTYTADVVATNAAPTATVTAPLTTPINTPLSFALGATDPSSADAAGTLSYAVAWGDGTTSTVTGPATASATHAYATAGTYTVSVVATDKDGGASAPATTTVTIPPAPPAPKPSTGGTGSGASAPVTGASAPAAVPVTVSGLAVTPRCLKASTATTRSVKLSYKLSGAATVRVTLQRATGSRAARTCPPQRGAKQDDGSYKPGSYAPVSTQQTTATSVLIGQSPKKALVAALRPSALVAKGQRLTAGTYLLTVTPLAADGKALTPARVKFWVLKG